MSCCAQEPAQGIAATVSVVILVDGATTVFAELQSALDCIWKVNAKKKSGIWASDPRVCFPLA